MSSKSIFYHKCFSIYDNFDFFTDLKENAEPFAAGINLYAVKIKSKKDICHLLSKLPINY
ncbi:MAG: hypothetical protein QW423_00190 [Candidatus Aenigmatarchaeota archaeon]